MTITSLLISSAILRGPLGGWKTLSTSILHTHWEKSHFGSLRGLLAQELLFKEGVTLLFRSPVVPLIKGASLLNQQNYPINQVNSIHAIHIKLVLHKINFPSLKLSTNLAFTNLYFNAILFIIINVQRTDRWTERQMVIPNITTLQLWREWGLTIF